MSDKNKKQIPYAPPPPIPSPQAWQRAISPKRRTFASSQPSSPNEGPSTTNESVTIGGHSVSPTIEQLAQQLHDLQLTVSKERSSRVELERELETLQFQSSHGSNQSPVQQGELLRGIRDAISQGMAEKSTSSHSVDQSEKQLQERVKALSSLITSSPKFDGSGDVMLWSKRIVEFLERRKVTDATMRVDVIQDSCTGVVQDFLGTLEEDFDEGMLLGELQERYGKDEFIRMGEYERLYQKTNQSYRDYADALSAKAYGLDLPIKSQLRHFIKTMRNSSSLRKFLLPTLKQYTSVRELASAVENLVQDDTDLPKSTAPIKCRICGKNHLARNCPQKAKTPGKSRANAYAEAYDEAADEESQEFAYYVEDDEYPVEEISNEESDQLSVEMASPVVQPAEKRAAPTQHDEAAKRLRGPDCPQTRSQTKVLPPIASQQQQPVVNVPVQRSPQKMMAPQQAAKPVVLPQRYRTPMTRVTSVKGKPKGLKQVLEGQVDIPVATLNGLVLQASGKPEQLAKQWMSRATSDAHELCQEFYQSNNTIELDDITSVEASAIVNHPATLNPLSTSRVRRSVGYIPLKVGTTADLTMWGMIDTGAQVSVISAGLANWLGLINEDLSNVLQTPFTVTGYNNVKSYMPIIVTKLRLGTQGGEERFVTVQLCVFDSNQYKLLIGVDILSQLQFVFNDRANKLHLISKEIRFNLPIVTKEYVQNSRAWKEYHAALPSEQQQTQPRIETTELCQKIEQAQLEGDISTLDASAVRYSGNDLQTILRTTQLVLDEQDIEDSESDLASENFPTDENDPVESVHTELNNVATPNIHAPVEAEHISEVQFGTSKLAGHKTPRLVRIWCGPMFSGKTTGMLNEVQLLREEGKRVTLVKAQVDDRFTQDRVLSHSGMTMAASQALAKLGDVVVQDADVLALDELHFFPDVAQALPKLLDQGIQVLATTLDRGAFGEPFFIWRKLEEAGVQPYVHTLKANCDECGNKEAATLSARLTPVGKSWVGAKDSYKSCCPNCFNLISVFHNPSVTLANPEYFYQHKEQILSVTGLQESQFCAAAAAAIITLQNKENIEGELSFLKCPHCNTPHLDQFEFALRAHKTHICQNSDCEAHWQENEKAISNPLAALNLYLQGDQLHLTLPKKQVNQVLPPANKTGDMGTAQLPSREQEQVLEGSELEKFLAKHNLVPSGESATLPKRAWKLQQALSVNDELLPADISSKQRQQALQMLLGVADVFCTDIEDLKTPAKGEPFEIDTGNEKPIKQKPFRLGDQEQTFLDKTISSQMLGGIITPSKSPWSSPVFVTYQRALNSDKPPKPRKVIDYRKVNSITKTDTYPLPDIPQTLEWLAQYKYMGAIDLKSGYWQKEVRKEDRQKTAFITPRAVLEYCRVPFGLKNAPSYFQREINKMTSTEGLEHSRSFIDDLLSGGHSWEDYLKNQEALLLACRKHGWLVTVSKVRLGYTSINVLGHHIGHGYIQPDPEKVKAIQNLKPPTNLREVRALLGLMGYYRRFLKEYAKLAKPITSLLAKNAEFKWGQDQQAAMEALQSALSNAVMLFAPKSGCRYRLYTDWSKDALGACLHQVQDDAEERPIAFASRLTRGPEGNLASSEGELAALIYGLGKFKSYLGFAEFDVFTDSSALRTIRTNQNLSGKLARWSLLLSEFNFVVYHKAGIKHKNADGLTRCPQGEQTTTEPYLQVWQLIQGANFLQDDLVGNQAQPSTQPDFAAQEINDARVEESRDLPCTTCGHIMSTGRLVRCGRCGQANHANCVRRNHSLAYWFCNDCRESIAQAGPQDVTEDNDVQSFLLGGPQPAYLSEEEATNLKQNFLFRRGQLLIDSPNGYKVYPPPYERTLIIERYHDRLMHPGITRTTAAISENYYWPGMEADIKRACQSCLACQLQTAVFRRRDEIGGHLCANTPRVSWSLDCAPALATPSGKRKGILIMVEDFTRMVILVPMEKLDSASVRGEFLTRVLAVYGRPKQVRTDRGREFLGQFSALLDELNIQHVQTRPVSPWTNGRAERMVRTVKSCLKRVLAARGHLDWVNLLPWLQAAINATISRATGFSPHEVMFGEPPSPLLPLENLPAVPSDLAEKPVGDFLRSLQGRLAVIRKEARRAQKVAQKQVEEDYHFTPLAGRQYGGESQIAVKQKFQTLEKGDMVIVKKPKQKHFDLGAAGPLIVLEDKGDSVRLQGLNGRETIHNKANCIKLKAGFCVN